LSGLDWPDIAINIAGFAPFGFFAMAFLSVRLQATTRAMLLAVACGVLVSLTIETGQYWLPTRTSSLIDVLTNGMGTALGVWAYLLFRNVVSLPGMRLARP
jgi:glycopeptide antibiotics resistance protein